MKLAKPSSWVKKRFRKSVHGFQKHVFFLFLVLRLLLEGNNSSLDLLTVRTYPSVLMLQLIELFIAASVCISLFVLGAVVFNHVQDSKRTSYQTSLPNF